MCLKQILRIEMLAKRKQNTSEKIAQMSNLVLENLLSMREVDEARIIMGYLSFDREISLDGFIEQTQLMGKKMCVPHIFDVENSIIKPSLLDNIESVELAEFGIRIPQRIQYVDHTNLDIVLVPGVAFSRQGQRLGMGKGYYDRFLPQTKALRVGICAKYNLLECLPVDEYDAYMDYLVTPEEIISCCKQDK